MLLARGYYNYLSKRVFMQVFWSILLLRNVILLESSRTDVDDNKIK